MRISMLIALIALGCGGDGGVSEDIDAKPEDCTWYSDADGDTYASPFESVQDACGEGAPEGTMAATDGKWDCDDSNADVNPDAEEVCDDVDKDREIALPAPQVGKSFAHADP